MVEGSEIEGSEIEGSDAAGDIRRWVETLVIGEGLCPFAGPVWERTRVIATEATGLEACLVAVEAELSRLVSTDAGSLATTLLVVPYLADDFDAYLDALLVVEAAIAQAGLEGVIQVASFHPAYRFADGPRDALGHYTNRAPWPVFHLLREADVEAAIEAHPDTGSIPARNIAHLEALGRPRVLALLAACRQGMEQ